MLALFLPSVCASVFAAGGWQQDNPAGRPASLQADVPPIPAVMTYPRDTTRLVRNPADTSILYYRTIAAVSFKDSVSTPTIRVFLHAHHVRIVGGVPHSRAYVVQFEDPGPDWRRFEAIVLSMNAEPFVDYAVWLTARDALPVVYSRPPGQDTGRPAVPDAEYWPSGGDTLRVVADRRFSDIVSYRDVFDVGFYDSTSGRTVRAFMARNRATIVGGSKWLGDYTVGVPDPGPSQDAFDALVIQLNREPGVEYAAPRTSRPGRIRESGLELGLASRVGTHGAVASRPPLDTTRLVFLADSTAIYRTDILLSFKDGVSDSTEAAFFGRHRMTVLRRIPETRVFFVRIPDPGPELQVFQDVLQGLNREPEVNAASFIPRQPLEQVDAAPSGSGPARAASVQAVRPGADTTRPPVPPNMFPSDDSLHTVPDPSKPEDVYYSTFAAVIFDDSVSGTGVRAFLRKYHAAIVGGLPTSRGYIIRFADAGPSWASLQALLLQMRTEPGVFVVMPEMRSGRAPEPDGQHPSPPA